MAEPIDDAARAKARQVFTHLGDLLYRGEEYDDAYRAVCLAATLLVDSCDHASLMMRKGDRWTTPAATDSIAATVDRLEREVGTGPCVDAVIDEVPQLAPDLNDPDAPWPMLRKMVLATTPVRGMLGFRIVHQQHKVAALNLFSDRAGGFTDAGVNQAAIVAAFCTVALQASVDRLEVTTLRNGLSSNREIGKAVGLLMAYHGIGDDAAFDILRTTSNQMNAKLSSVADRIVAGHLDQIATED